MVNAPIPAFSSEICLCLLYKCPFVTNDHLKPRFRNSLPHISISFRIRGSPPVKTTVKFSGIFRMVSTAFKKSSIGMSSKALSFAQSLPQCKQFKLHLVVHSQNK